MGRMSLRSNLSEGRDEGQWPKQKEVFVRDFSTLSVEPTYLPKRLRLLDLQLSPIQISTTEAEFILSMCDIL